MCLSGLFIRAAKVAEELVLSLSVRVESGFFYLGSRELQRGEDPGACILRCLGEHDAGNLFICLRNCWLILRLFSSWLHFVLQKWLLKVCTPSRRFLHLVRSKSQTLDAARLPIARADCCRTNQH